MKESGKRHGDPRNGCSCSRCGLPGPGRKPVHKNGPRPTPGLLRMSYLTLALCASALSAAAFFSAAAAMAEGSAKAITASPSSKL
jgi:hypothetical protein